MYFINVFATYLFQTNRSQLSNCENVVDFDPCQQSGPAVQEAARTKCESLKVKSQLS